MIVSFQSSIRAAAKRVEYLSDRYFSHFALLPVLILLTAASLVPFLISLALSFTDFSFNLPDHNGAFIGLNNYFAVLEDVRFHQDLKTQFLFLVCTVPIEFGFGLWIAWTLAKSEQGRGRLLPFFVVPMLLAPVTVGMIWRLLLHGDYGPIGYYLTRQTLFSMPTILGDPRFAFGAIVFVDIWQWTPLFIVVLLASLLNLPQAPIRAAQLDGATRAQVFWTITLPMLRPALTVALLMRGMDTFKEFDKIWVLTRGGPASSTELTSVYTWIVSFDHGALGYASALNVVLYAMVYLGSVAVFHFLRRDWYR